MLNSVEISVIIPSYLEAENLKFILPKLNNVLTSSGVNYEILVIDTLNSMDHTPKICAENNVKYFNRNLNNDFGSAIRTGIKKACGKKIIFMDADGSHDPEFILELLKHKDSHDIVVASRYIQGGGIESTKLSIFMSRVLNLSYRFILNINCNDLSNNFKLYDAPQLRNLKLTCHAFDIVEEIIFKFIKNNKQAKIMEVPYIFKQRVHGKTKRNLLIFIFMYGITILKLRFSK